MNKFLIGAVGMVAVATSASAADLAARPYTKAPPPMMTSIYDWSGFYVGLNGGGGWSHKCWERTDVAHTGSLSTFLPPLPPLPPILEGSALFDTGVPSEFAAGCHDATGGTVGGQIGYRWQRSVFVFGLEAQGNWADFKGDNVSLLNFNVRNQSKIDAFGLFTGQVGYAWNNVLLYVKGGAAVTNDKYTGLFIPTGLAFDSATETRWGGVVGVGLEYGFTPNWSFGVEYDHMFMGDRDVSLYGTGTYFTGLSRIERIQQDVDMVTARINYRFGGPVVARY